MEVIVEEAPDLAGGHLLTPRQRRQAILAATLGNGLEFYDFITFAFFAIQIGHTFFPWADKYHSLQASLLTFFAGFLTRPVGAYILGGYADRVGRKPAMMISMSMMGFGIALLVLTPGYNQIGIAAPVIAVVARMIQGFALGGEVGSATIYLMEGADPHRRAFSMSWQGASQNIAASVGLFVGLLLTYWLTDAELTAYGWRITLSFGLLIIPVALWVRSSLPETIHHSDSAPVELAHFSDRLGEFGAALRRCKLGWLANALNIIWSYPRPIICGLVIIGTGTIGNYIFQYMATFGQDTLHLSTRLSLAGEFANNAISVVAVLFGAAVSDRKGRKHVMLLPQLLFCVLIVPCFLWLTTERDAVSFIGANLILSYISGYMYGAVYAAISESIPKELRARIFALVYSVPVALLGGSTQSTVHWLLNVTGSPMSIAWYLTAISLIGFGAMYALKESAPVKLAQIPAAAFE